MALALALLRRRLISNAASSAFRRGESCGDEGKGEILRMRYGRTRSAIALLQGLKVTHSRDQTIHELFLPQTSVVVFIRSRRDGVHLILVSRNPHPGNLP